jgi:hypothetical protein
MNRKETIADASPMYRGLLTKALDGTASPRGAIKAFCLRCVGYIRQDVTDCTAVNCPLHQYRPYQGAQDTDSDAEAGE